MEKSFRMSIDTEAPHKGLRADLVFSKEDGRTRITVSMGVPNRIGHLAILQAQADVIRMAMDDLQREHDSLLRSLADHSATP